MPREQSSVYPQTSAAWPAEWLRGVLEVCVLRILADGPSYGYAITKRLSEAGLGSVKAGTLYPLLSRLEESGHVEVEWRPGRAGPGRKFYVLTGPGRTAAAAQARRWTEFTAVTRNLLDDVVTPR